MESSPPAKKEFKNYPIGYFYFNIAEVRPAEGKRYLFVAIDRISTVTYVELHDNSDRNISTVFLRHLAEALPHKIDTVLTDNGSQFCQAPRYRNGPKGQYVRHMFDKHCNPHCIEHRLTKPKHPWTNGQV